MRLWPIIATVSAVLVSFPAHARDSELYAKVGGWSVFRNSDDCNLIASFDRNTDLYISYTVGTNNVTVLINDPAFKSVKDDQKYPVSIYFKKNGRLDDGWGDMDAVGLVTETMSAITLKLTIGSASGREWSPGALSHQTRTVPSSDAVTTRWPSGLRLAVWTRLLWPRNTATGSPVSMFQTRAVRSHDVVNTSLLSGLNDVVRRTLSWPRSVVSSLPSAASKMET